MFDYKKLDYSSLEKLFYLYSLTSFYRYMDYDYTMPMDSESFDYFTYLLKSDLYFKSLYDKYQSFRNNKNRKKKRVINCVSNLLNKDCLFLTLTFRNDILTKYSNKKLRELVSRYLSSFNVPYIANIDYGSSYGRVHFHAILQKDCINYSSWKYGAINGKKIIGSSDPSKIAHYITKLSFHSFKDTTKDQRVIYSRNFSSVINNNTLI